MCNQLVINFEPCKLEIKWELELLAPRKYPYPPYGWSLETLKGWGGGGGGLKGQNF